MIHYHGCPLGGPRFDRNKFYTGRHAMVSWVYDEDISVVANVCQSFVVDNGAFTLWKKGSKRMSQEQIDGYYNFCSLWGNHPACDWCAIPDIITGNEKDNDEMLKDWPFKFGVPVWHMHESLDRLLQLASTYQIVALGSSGDYSNPNSRNWWNRMKEALREICDGETRTPICKLHGMRMLDPAIFTKLPLHSADSTNAVINSNRTQRFGMYAPPSRAERAAVIASRIEAHQSAPTFTHTDIQTSLFPEFEMAIR